MHATEKTQRLAAEAAEYTAAIATHTATVHITHDSP